MHRGWPYRSGGAVPYRVGDGLRIVAGDRERPVGLFVRTNRALRSWICLWFSCVSLHKAWTAPVRSLMDAIDARQVLEVASSAFFVDQVKILLFEMWFSQLSLKFDQITMDWYRMAC